jgi:hypothetical protein
MPQGWGTSALRPPVTVTWSMRGAALQGASSPALRPRGSSCRCPAAWGASAPLHHMRPSSPRPSRSPAVPREHGPSRFLLLLSPALPPQNDEAGPLVETPPRRESQCHLLGEGAAGAAGADGAAGASGAAEGIPEGAAGVPVSPPQATMAPPAAMSARIATMTMFFMMSFLRGCFAAAPLMPELALSRQIRAVLLVGWGQVRACR